MAKKMTSVDLGVPSFDCISVTRYTFDSWMKCYPKSNEREWEIRTSPGDVLDFVENALDELKVEKSALRVVTIDTDYFNWLKENKLSNTSKARAKYAETIDDKKAYSLIQQRLDNEVVRVFGMSMTLVKPDYVEGTISNLKLSKDAIKKLTDYLNAIYGLGNVYVPGYVIDAERMVLDAFDFNKGARRFFENGSPYENDVWKNQDFKHPDVNIIRLYIPIAIRSIFKSAVFHHVEDVPEKEVVTYAPEGIMFTEDEFELHGIKQTPFLDSEAYEHLQGLFGLANIEPFLLAIDEIPGFESSFYENLELGQQQGEFM